MTDTGVYGAAMQLLEVLVRELANTRAGEPATSTLHAGTLVPDYGQHFDGDREGFCSVRIADIVPTLNFPAPVNKPVRGHEGGSLQVSVVLEMVVTRCYGHPERNDMPPLGQLDSDVRDIVDDAAAMRRAAQLMSREAIPGAWRPRPQQGGIHGGSMTVTVPVPGYCDEGYIPGPLDAQFEPVDGDPRFR
jgi:hypothetical protein